MKLLPACLLLAGCSALDRFYDTDYAFTVDTSGNSAAGKDEAPAGCPDCAGGGYVADPLVLEQAIGKRSGLGTVTQPAGTRVPAAQEFCDQGLACLHSYAFVDAARSFHEALRLDPACALAWTGLARAEQGLGRKDAKYAAITKAAESAAKATAREQRLVELRRLQMLAEDAPAAERAARHAEYKRQLDAALAELPDEAELWLQRGNAEEDSPAGRGQGGGAASIAFYESALRRAPGHFGAHHYLTHSFENLRRYDQALMHAREYVQAAPDAPHAHHMAGHVLPRQGLWAEAIEHFAAADRLHLANAKADAIPVSDDWHYAHNLKLLAWSLLRVGKPEQAEACFARLRATPIRDPERSYDHAMLAEFLLVQGRAAEALVSAREVAAETGSARPAGRALAAEALFVLGRADEARAELAKAKQEPHQDRANLLIEVVEARFLGGDREAVRRELDGLASFDGWGVGYFRAQRLQAPAAGTAGSRPHG